MGNYINKEEYRRLFEQFKQANGIRTVENFEDHQTEFFQWLEMLQLQLDSYVNLLVDKGVRNDKGVIIELGKSVHDTTTTRLAEKGLKVMAVTPEFKKFFKTNVTSLNGVLTEVAGKPMALGLYLEPIVQQTLTPLNNAETFITQLPHQRSNEIGAMIKLSAGNYNIVLGSYGHKSDKDVKFKIEHLRAVKETIESIPGMIADEMFERNGDIYLHFIKTRQIILKHDLTKHR